MNSVLEILVLVFASVGLTALGHWIFRSRWGTVQKMIGILLVVSLWWAMVNGPLQGHFGSDHGVLSGLLATLGIVLLVPFAFRWFGRGRWQPWCVSGVALVLLVLMWFPRFDASAQAVPPVVPQQVPTPAPAPGPVGPNSNQHLNINCSALSPEGRQAAGCQ